MPHHLVGVGVEDVVRSGGEQHPGPEVGIVDLGHVAEVTAHGAIGVLNLRLVHSGSSAQDVGALQRFDAGAADVVVHHALTDGRSVHAPEQVQGLGPLGFGADLGEQAVGTEVTHRGDGHSLLGQGAGQAAAKVDAGEHILARGVDVLDDAAQPAGETQFLGLTGGPDIHGPEVGQAAVGVADALDDGQIALVPVLLQGGHGRVEAQLVGDGYDLVLWDPQSRAVVPVMRIGVRDDRVHSVVATGQRNHCQDRFFYR